MASKRRRERGKKEKERRSPVIEKKSTNRLVGLLDPAKRPSLVDPSGERKERSRKEEANTRKQEERRGKGRKE
jgi:hypothetical protein